MDPGLRSPLIEYFKRGQAARDARLLAAQGALPTPEHEQLALLVLLSDDPDAEIAQTAEATIRALPVDALRAFLAGADVPEPMKQFFADRGIHPAGAPAGDAGPEVDADSDEAGDEDDAELPEDATPQVLANLPVKTKVKLATKGTREQRAQLIRDPNRMVASAVLSSPKLTEVEVESFARMQNVSEEVLRVIASNRSWMKNYGVVLGLVKNAKTPIAISMQLLPRINERDMKMLAIDRNIPEPLRLAARKFIVKAMK